jgi:hypothetical protein
MVLTTMTDLDASQPTAAWLVPAGIGLGLACAAWFALEYQLRGARDLVLSEPFFWTVAGGVLLFGIITAPRMSWRGEFRVLREIALLLVIAISLLPAAMLALYLIASVSSLVLMVLAWILFLLLLLLMVVVQVLAWGLAITSVVVLVTGLARRRGEIIAAGVGLLVVAGVVLGIVADTWPKHNHLPGPLSLFDRLRDTLAGLQVEQVLAITLSALLGALLGAGVITLLRAIRTRLLVFGELRYVIPGGAAPVSDDRQVLQRALLLPALFWLTLIWCFCIVLYL